MTILEKVKSTFLDCKPGQTFSRREIVDMVKSKYPTDDFARSSIIPSDYCYNRINKGKLDNPDLLDFNIFSYADKGEYTYFGSHYPYDGKIFRRPRGTYIDSEAGCWVKGKRTLTK